MVGHKYKCWRLSLVWRRASSLTHALLLTGTIVLLLTPWGGCVLLPREDLSSLGWRWTFEMSMTSVCHVKSCLTFLCHWLWFCIWGPKYAKTAHLEIHKYIDAVCTYLEPSNPLHWHNKPSVTLPDRNARMIFNLQSYKNLAFLWHYIDIDSRQQQQRCPWEDQDDELSEAAHDDDNSTMIQQHWIGRAISAEICEFHFFANWADNMKRDLTIINSDFR